MHRERVLMPCQESSLNDDPRFTAHEPKWCLSDSIKGLIPSKERLIIAVGDFPDTGTTYTTLKNENKIIVTPRRR